MLQKLQLVGPAEATHSACAAAHLRKVDDMLSAARPNFQHKPSRREHAAKHGGNGVPVAQHRRRIETQVSTASSKPEISQRGPGCLLLATRYERTEITCEAVETFKLASCFEQSDSADIHCKHAVSTSASFTL